MGLLRSNQKGLTIIELMIVLAIIGILAAVGIPVFTGVKDRAIKDTTKTNLETIRRSLFYYSANNPSNLFPRGPLTWTQVRAEIPKANLPASEEDAKIVTGTFQYVSASGFGFTITALSLNSTAQPFLCDPEKVIEN